jgi:S-ribosylhomocysteine lyase LuxS involved in autoinducer biosynthesis
VKAVITRTGTIIITKVNATAIRSNGKKKKEKEDILLCFELRLSIKK